MSQEKSIKGNPSQQETKGDARENDRTGEGKKLAFDTVLISERFEDAFALRQALQLLDKREVYQKDSPEGGALIGVVDGQGNLVFGVVFKDTGEEESISIPSGLWQYKHH